MQHRSVVIPFLLISFLAVFHLTNLDFFVIFIFFTTFCPLIIFFLFLFRFVRSGLFFSFGKYFNKIFPNISVLFYTYFHIASKMAGTRSNDALLIRDEDGLRNCDEVCLRIDSDTYVEVATKRYLLLVINSFYLV